MGRHLVQSLLELLDGLLIIAHIVCHLGQIPDLGMDFVCDRSHTVILGEEDSPTKRIAVQLKQFLPYCC